MKKFTTRFAAFALMGLLFVACKEEKKETSETVVSENPETTTETATTEKSAETAIAVLNANLATESDLQSIGLPAEKIVQIIEKRPFLTMNDLDALVDTNTDKTELYKKLFVPFNLNTTAEKDFKMIPGVGDRMAHEFEEYRPYKSIQQFRREIGKYVDEDEVARYENYVFVPIDLNSASDEDMQNLPGVGKRMAHEFEEYRPYKNMEQFRREIGKYVDDKELARLERFVYIK